MEKFEELLQDLEVLSIAAERRNEESISHDVVKKALKVMASYKIKWKKSAVK